jgi:SdrD B-like domain
MATQNHQKLNGAAKRSGRTTKSRSLAALMAGATLGGVLAAGGALGFIETAKALTNLNGRTFIDIDGNGRLDVSANPSFSDRAIGGVTVTAFERGGVVVGSTVSKADGTWEIIDAAGSGPYRIEFSNLPANTFEGFNRQFTNLQSGSNSANFGLFAKLDGLGNVRSLVDSDIEGVQLGDRVWVDTDGNGIQDPSERGVAGVRVELLVNGQPYTDANNVPVSTVTDANGNYVFTNILQSTVARPLAYAIRIPAGQGVLAPYTLTVANAPGSNKLNGSDGIAQTDGSVVAPAVAPKIGADMSYDFGYRPNVQPPVALSLGDTVWLDANRDGLFNPGESTVQGASVVLLNEAGTVVAGVPPQFTGADGKYLFVNLVAGKYRVRFSRPAGSTLTPTAAKTGTNDSIDSDGVGEAGNASSVTGVIDLQATNLNVDAGWVAATTATYCVGDQVWNDTNKDGLLNNGEAGVSGVTVTLLDSANNPAVPSRAAVTDANGRWQLCSLPNGNYKVRFSKPAGFDFTKQAVSANDGQSSADPATGISLPGTIADKDCVCLDAGLVKIDVPVVLVDLGDTVWLDANGDGLKGANETTVKNATVTLLDAAGNAVPGVAPQVTGDDGRYLFTKLPQGKYRVRFARPADSTVIPTAAKTSTDDAVDSDGLAETGNATSITAVIDLQATNLNVDAGWKEDPASVKVDLGDTVWLDANGDGLKDANELAVKGATVTLLDEAGNAVASVAPQVTGDDGKYLFPKLPKGKYRVRFARPAGSDFTPTKAKVGTDNILDSDGKADAGNATSTTDVIDLQATDLNVDAGWVTPAKPVTGLRLGDLVFLDTDRDGLAFAKDTPVEGALVELLNETGTGAAIKSTRSDANGKYLFTDLTAGKYRVRFTRPDGTTVTPTTTKATADNLNDSDGVKVSDSVSLTDVIELKADDLTIDAGWVITPTASTYCLGDLVFDDVNGNGLKEDNEPGVNGIVVTVTNSNGVSAQTTTANGGAWKVCGLSNGNFTVAFSKLAGYDFTIQGDGNNRSNVDANGKTGTVTIANGDNLGVDAGIKASPTSLVIAVIPVAAIPVATTVAPTTAAPTTVPAASLCIGDKVFVDATGSAKDGKGISGVTVTLVRPDGTTATATTDASGAYKFCSLSAGAYSVKVSPATLPAGAVATYDLAGKKNNEATVTLTNADNADLDFGYKLPSASVLGNTVETAPPAAAVAEEPIAFTGSNTTTTMLWGLALLMMGMGFAGLMVDRRRTVTR